MATDASRPALLVAFAIMTIFFLVLSASICEGCPVYVAGGAPVSGGVW